MGKADIPFLGVQLEELVLPETKILEKLNAVSTAKRLANMVGTVEWCCKNF